jgi:hypothetical protein
MSSDEGADLAILLDRIIGTLPRDYQSKIGIICQLCDKTLGYPAHQCAICQKFACNECSAECQSRSRGCNANVCLKCFEVAVGCEKCGSTHCPLVTGEKFCQTCKLNQCTGCGVFEHICSEGECEECVYTRRHTCEECKKVGDDVQYNRSFRLLCGECMTKENSRCRYCKNKQRLDMEPWCSGCKLIYKCTRCNEPKSRDHHYRNYEMCISCIRTFEKCSLCGANLYCSYLFANWFSTIPGTSTCYKCSNVGRR